MGVLASKELRQLAPTSLALAVLVLLAPALGLVAAASRGASEAPAAAAAGALVMAALLLGATAGTGDAAPAFESARPMEGWAIAITHLGVRAATLVGLGIVGLAVMSVASSFGDLVLLPPAEVLAAIAWWVVAALMASALASAFVRRPSAAAVHGAWMIGLLFLATTPEGAVGSFAGLAASKWLGVLALAALTWRLWDETRMRRVTRLLALGCAGAAIVAIVLPAIPIALRTRAAHRELGRAWTAWDAIEPRSAMTARGSASDEPLDRLRELFAPLDFWQLPDQPQRDRQQLERAYFGHASVNELVRDLASARDPSRVEIPGQARDWLASEADSLRALTGFLLEEERPILAAAATSEDEIAVPMDRPDSGSVMAFVRSPHRIELWRVGEIERIVMIDALMASRQGDVERALRDVAAATRLCRDLGDGLEEPASRVALVSCHREILTVVRAMDTTTPVTLDEDALAVVRDRATDGVRAAGRDTVRRMHVWLDELDPLSHRSPSAWWSPLREALRRFELRNSRSEQALSDARQLVEESATAAQLRDVSSCEVAFLPMRGELGRYLDGWEGGTRPSPPADDLTLTHFALRRLARFELEAELTRVVLMTRATPPAASDQVPSKLCPGAAWRRDVLADGCSIRISCWRAYEPDDPRQPWTVSLVHVVHPRSVHP